MDECEATEGRSCQNEAEGHTRAPEVSGRRGEEWAGLLVV